MHETEISFGGIDVGKYKSVAVVIGKNGNIIRESKLPTTLEHLCTFFAEIEPKPSLIALESGAFGRALCMGLRNSGFNAIVIDARHAAPVLRGMKRQKTDRNDAIAIANLVRIGAYREVWLRSVESRNKLTRLHARECLLKIELVLKNAIGAHLMSRGYAVKFGQRREYVRTLDSYFQQLHRDDDLRCLYGVLKVVGSKIKWFDKKIASSVSASPVCLRLMSMPGVGPLTAAWFEAVIDEPKRFKRSRDVGPFLGLIPSLHQTGSVKKMGHITKAGSSELRRNLYLAARTALYSVKHETALKAWATRLRKQKGGKLATIALARRMAVALHAIWVSGKEFSNNRVG